VKDTTKTSGESTPAGINLDDAFIELKAERRWICWRYEMRDGEETKVPYNPVTGKKAQSNHSDTWTTFEKALAVVNNYNGLGIMLRGSDLHWSRS
jgi:putative DNA primase/helicase